MMRQKIIISLRVALIATLTFLLVIPTSVFASPVSEETLNELYDYRAYYYNPDGGCDNGSDNVGQAIGNTYGEKVWNWLISANIEGVSDNRAALAGIMGNLFIESSFNPYSHTSGKAYYGLFQTDVQSVIQKVSALGDYWGKDAPDDIASKAIDIELSMLVNDQVWSEKRFQLYLKGLEMYPGNSLENAKLDAELFMVAVERCVGSSTERLSGKAEAFATTIGSHVTDRVWQGRSAREEAAAKIYEDTEHYPSSGASSSTSSSSASANDGSNVTIIGDSITAGSTEEIKKLLPKADINAVVGRQLAKSYGDDSGYANVKKTIDAGNLRKILVFPMGSNDSKLKESQLQEVIDLVNKDGDHQIILATNFKNENNNKVYNDNNNKIINNFAKKYDNVSVIDWANAVSADPTKYISTDKLHPTAEGQKLFAQLIADAVNNTANSNSSRYDPCNTRTNSPYTGDSIPQYFQCRETWSNLMYGKGGIYGKDGSTICDSGCGPTSFAMLVTALLGENITPDQTADIAGKAGMHISGVGSLWDITKVLADYYGLQFKDLGTCNIDTINQYLRDGWMIHTSGTGSAPFTPNGHMIGIAGVNSQGQWLIANSAARDNANKYYDPQEVINAGMYCSESINVKAIKK